MHEAHAEKVILDHLRHKRSVVRLYSTFHDAMRLYFVLDYLPNGSLQDLMRREKRLNPALIKHIAAELIISLIELRESQVIHRDLKPGNILFDDEHHLKLIDFSTSKCLDPDVSERIPRKKKVAKSNIDCAPFDGDEEFERVTSLVGTEEYVAPEVVLGESISYATDLWSFGIIIYQMLAQTTPFKGINQCQTFHKILNKSDVDYSSIKDTDAVDLI